MEKNFAALDWKIGLKKSSSLAFKKEARKLSKSEKVNLLFCLISGSSVFSAAHAVRDHLRDWYFGSEDEVSMGVLSNGCLFNLENMTFKKILFFHFPVDAKENLNMKS